MKKTSKSWFTISPAKCVVYFVVTIIVIFLLGISRYVLLETWSSSSSAQQPALRGEGEPQPPPPPLQPTSTLPDHSLKIDPNPVVEETQQARASVPVTASRPKVAVAITVTKDGPFVDGALVLGYAAKKYHSANLGYPSRFDIELVAFVTKKVVTTRPILSKFGWKILERDLPVALSEIGNQDYAQRMRDSGCCGADEFLKLWAYTLTEYSRVLHFDMDCIIFKNLDTLLSIDKELLYTGDYNMKGHSPVPPVQGGFLVIRPSMERFHEFQAIIRKGDHGTKGWGGSKIGNFWGGQTIQGIMPYFYHIVHPGDGEEMNRCQYNNMVDNPYFPNTVRCINGQPQCEDCRASDPEEVYTAHFTICQKPWTCTEHLNPRNKVLCEAFHKKWFALRDEMERALEIPLTYRSKQTRFKESLGMCRGYGDKKYLPMPIDLVQDPQGKY
eukprot:gene5802-6390_t